MSMVNIGIKSGQRTTVHHLHYGDGILSWEKYHALRARQAQKRIDEAIEVGDDREEAYWKARYDESFKSAHYGISPNNPSGCEREAADGGYWVCNSAKERAAYRKAKRAINYEPDTDPATCELFLDFDRSHAIVRDRSYVEWEELLPEGWTFELDLKEE